MCHMSTPHILGEEKDYLCYLEVEMRTEYYSFRAHDRHSSECSQSPYRRDAYFSHWPFKTPFWKKKTTPKFSIIPTDIYVG